MLRSLLLAALAVLPLAASSQTAPAVADPVLDPVAAVFESDLQTVVRLATAAALVHDRTGAFPSDAFGILGPAEGAATGASRVPLSHLTVDAPPAAALAAGAVGAFTAVPLPTDPYVRDDTPIRVVMLRRADGVYEAQYRITRERDPDLGGGRRSYQTAGRFDVRSGVGSVCIEPARARAMIAAGAFVPDPTRLSDEPLTIRVVPPGQDAPLYYQTTREGAR